MTSYYHIGVIILACLCMNNPALHGQYSNNFIHEGIIIYNSGQKDSLEIKLNLPEMQGKYVEARPDSLDYFVKILPNQVHTIIIDTLQIHTKINEIEGQESVSFYFLITEGPVSLYQKANSPMETGINTWYLEGDNDRLIRIEKERFVKHLSYYFYDYRPLVRDLKKERYTYREMPEIVERYNNWVLMGRPEGSVPVESNTVMQNIIKTNETLLDFELISSLNHGFHILPRLLRDNPVSRGNEIIQINKLGAGLGYKLGGGIKIAITPGFNFMANLSYSRIQYNPSYLFTTRDSLGMIQQQLVNIDGQITSSAIHLFFVKRWYHSFFGGGFTMGLNTNYESTYRKYDHNENLIMKIEDYNQTIFSNGFINQLNINILAGLNHHLPHHVIIRPYAQASFPVLPLYQTNIIDPRDNKKKLNPRSILVEFGAIISVGISPYLE